MMSMPIKVLVDISGIIIKTKLSRKPIFIDFLYLYKRLCECFQIVINENCSFKIMYYLLATSHNCIEADFYIQILSISFIFLLHFHSYHLLPYSHNQVYHATFDKSSLQLFVQ